MISEGLKIEIRPIPDSLLGGKDKFFNMKAGLGSLAQSHTVGPMVDKRTRRFDTGLSADDLKWINEQGFAYDLSTNFKNGVAHPFWEAPIARTELKSSPMFLFPGADPLDLIKWRYLCKSPLVYSSEQEMALGGKPRATHYIYDESEEIVKKATIIAREDKLRHQCLEMTPNRKRDLVLIILDEDTETKPEVYLNVKLDEIVKDKEKSVELERLLNAKPAEVNVEALIKNAISRNVIKKTAEGYKYFETPLGYTEKDVKALLSKVEKQQLFLDIQAKTQ